jgi:hypothetical protein
VKLFDDLQGRFHRGNPLMGTAWLNRHRCTGLSTSGVRERDVEFGRPLSREWKDRQFAAISFAISAPAAPPLG